MSHWKTHWEQMKKDLIQEAERWDPEPKLISLWVTSILIFKGECGHFHPNKNGASQNAFRSKL